jgi:hypothetical protein
MLTSKPTTLSELPSDERRKNLATNIKTNATTPYSDWNGKPCSPLFDRPGIKDNLPLQRAIIRLATEYADMLLLQDAVLDRGAKEDKMTRALIRKEFVTWTTHALDSIEKSLRNEISANQNPSNYTDEHINKHSSEIMAAVIKLSLVTKSKLNGKAYIPGDIPSAFGLKSIPIYMESYVTSYAKLKGDETQLKRFAQQELVDINTAVKKTEIPVKSSSLPKATHRPK